MVRTAAFRRKIVLAALLTGACAKPGADRPVTLEVPGRTSAHVSLAADGNRVAAAWAATGVTGTDVFFALSGDAGRTFSSPTRVNDVNGDANANGEQPPRVVMRGSQVDVLWVSKTGGVATIRAAASSDGGSTFGPARTITPSGVGGARGWESAALSDDGTVHAVWLDGRNASALHAPHAPGAPHAPHAPGAPPMRQDIYHAVWRANEPPAETAVATDVCFCCKTAIATRGVDVYVAWRHLFPGGVRDIAVARSTDGGLTFSSPVRVSADNWKLDACPDDGPAMALDPDGTLHVVWPTLVGVGRDAHIAIFGAESRDGGATFTPRVRVSDPAAAASHPRIATSAAGTEAIVWDEIVNGARRVRMREAGTEPVLTFGSGAAGYPAVAAASGGFVLAWTEQRGERSLIRTTVVGEAQR
ncbi:MAG TPA: hypothetical protein VL225_04245 [Vicinamibacterales bacterium]|nr:hypothetical protein [Vicinamibacterales bacterium]